MARNPMEILKQKAKSRELYEELMAAGSQRKLAALYGIKRSGNFTRLCNKSKFHWESAMEEEDFTEDIFKTEAGQRVIANAYYKQNKALLQQLEQEQNRNRVISETIARHVSPLKAIEFPQATKRSDKADQAMFVMLSDIHVGEWVRGDETAGLSEYNYDIFKRRKDNLLHSFTNVIDGLRRAYKIDHLYILGLGDWVTGEDIFPKQQARIDLLLQEQIFAGASEIGKMILQLSSMFTSTNCFLQYGNHGRERLTTNNNDLMCYQWIRQLLIEQENIKFNVSGSTFNSFSLGEGIGPLDFAGNNKVYNYMLLHGNQAKSYSGFPWYGVGRVKLRSGEMIGETIDKVFIGHHHQDASAAGWQANGNWVGGTEYSIENMQGCGRPSQHICTFTPEFGIGFNLEMYLDDAPKLQAPDENGARTAGMSLPSLEKEYDFSRRG